MIEEENIKKEMAPFVQKYNRLQQNIDKINVNVALFNKKKLDFFKTADKMNYFSQSMKHYRFAIEQSKIERDKLDEEFNKIKVKLGKAIVKRKALEILKDKDFLKYKKEKQKKEQIFLEEASSGVKLKMLF